MKNKIIKFLTLSFFLIVPSVSFAENPEFIGIGENFRSIDYPIIAFSTDEKNINLDLNNDGDKKDRIIRYFNIETKELINTKILGDSVYIDNGIISFTTHEGSIKLDLNNDGDMTDVVIRYYDTTKNILYNTLQVGYDPIIKDNFIYFRTISGLYNASIIKIYDIATGKVINIGIGGQFSYDSIDNNIISFISDEQNMKIDLNKDGDTIDLMVGYYDVLNKKLNVISSGFFIPAINKNILAFISFEGYMGADEDLDGDGDKNDFILQYYDISRNQLINTKLIGYNIAKKQNDNICFNIPEHIINIDLNNDNYLGTVIGCYNITTSSFSNTGLSGSIIGFDKNNVLFYTSEFDLNQDIDSDGIISKKTEVFGYYNLISKQTNIYYVYNDIRDRLVVTSQFIDDDYIIFQIIRWEGYGQDLNNDGDTEDQINEIFYYRINSEEIEEKLPVILLPGVLGSWTDNFFELFTNPNPVNQNKLSLTEESQAWFWRQLDDLGYLPHTWQDLKNKLPEMGYPTYKCPFDWRNINEYSAQKYLMPCIDKAKQETDSDKINIIAHSMGGLIARAYIQNDSLYRNDINKFTMIGTPNHGSPNAYYSWEGGSLSAPISINISSWSGILGAIFENTVSNRLTQMATHFLRTGKVSYIHSFFPSLQELLPTFDYLENQFGSVRNILSMIWQNNFLNDLNSRSNISKLGSQINTKIFAGEGHSTLETIKVLYPNPDNLFGNPNNPYPDGLPIPLLEEKSDLGDGTVLSQKSAKITETAIPFETKTKTSDNPENFLQHTNLPNSFLNEIVSFLGGQLTTYISYSPKLPKEILAISLASPAELLIVDMQGRKLGFDYQSQLEKYEIPKGIYSGKDELELAMIIDPQPGEYKVSVIGNGNGEFDTGISYAKEDCEQSISQDNFGQITADTIITFTLNFQSDCRKDAVKYSLDSIIDIDPNVLNIDSKGNYITAYIELPSLYKVEDIDVSTIKLNNQISAIWFLKTIGDYDNDGIMDLMVKFKRNEVQNIISIGESELSVSGNLRDGTRFEGNDAMRVINRK